MMIFFLCGKSERARSGLGQISYVCIWCIRSRVIYLSALSINLSWNVHTLVYSSNQACCRSVKWWIVTTFIELKPGTQPCVNNHLQHLITLVNSSDRTFLQILQCFVLLDSFMNLYEPYIYICLALCAGQIKLVVISKIINCYTVQWLGTQSHLLVSCGDRGTKTRQKKSQQQQQQQKKPFSGFTFERN